jgi:ASCH domain.
MEISNNKVHELKTWPDYFKEVFMGHKNFEIRKNDRNFQCGDILILKEWDPEHEEYTGRMLARNVLYVLAGGQFGIEPNFVVMSIG